MPKRRASDQRWWRRVALGWRRFGADLTTTVAVALAAYAVVVSTNVAGDSKVTSQDAKRASAAALRAASSAKAAVRSIRTESKERINETCRISETKQRADVDALKRTYEYLSGLSTPELAQPLNRAVLAQLPRTVRDAETDDAPAYCDAAGVGLPEPDPRLPKRPRGLPAP